jgi:hypothetical protein
MRTNFPNLLLLLALVSGAAGCESSAETPAMPASSQPAAIDLSTHQWKDRVIVIFAPAAADANAVQQRASLEADPQAIAGRDLVVIEVIGDLPNATALRRQYGVPVDQFAVLLIGKDGGEKLRAAAPVEPSEIFRLIDSMPMRQREIRQ